MKNILKSVKSGIIGGILGATLAGITLSMINVEMNEKLISEKNRIYDHELSKTYGNYRHNLSLITMDDKMPDIDVSIPLYPEGFMNQTTKSTT